MRVRNEPRVHVLGRGRQRGTVVEEEQLGARQGESERLVGFVAGDGDDRGAVGRRRGIGAAARAVSLGG